MQPIVIIALLILPMVCACTSSSEPYADSQTLDTAYYMPAQFEPQEAVWLGGEAHALYHPVNVAMVKALLHQVQIMIVSESDSISGLAKKTLANEVAIH